MRSIAQTFIALAALMAALVGPASWSGRKPLVFVGQPSVEVRMLCFEMSQYRYRLIRVDQTEVTGEIEHGTRSVDELLYEFVLSVISERRWSRLIDCGQIDRAHPMSDVVGSSHQLHRLSVQALVSLFPRYSLVRRPRLDGPSPAAAATGSASANRFGSPPTRLTIRVAIESG